MSNSITILRDTNVITIFRFSFFLRLVNKFGPIKGFKSLFSGCDVPDV